MPDDATRAESVRCTAWMDDCKRRADEAWKALCKAEQARTRAERRANAAYREWGERQREYRAAESSIDEAHRGDEARPST